MKHIKLFEAFINENKAKNNQPFTSIGEVEKELKRAIEFSSKDDEDQTKITEDFIQNVFLFLKEKYNYILDKNVDDLNFSLKADNDDMLKRLLYNIIPKLKKAKAGEFSLDGGNIYKGYTNGGIWNGWECPYFEKEEADKIAKDYNGEFVDDTYVFPNDDDDVYESENLETVDGKKKVWAIGAYAWVWEKE